jgi:hypothetical protein
MKTIIALILLVPAIVYAQSQTQTGQQTCLKTTISHTTPTELTGNLANPRAFTWAVKVTNIDATANLFCSQKSNVATSGANTGEIIAPASAPPYNFLAWIVNMTQPWYCKSDGVADTSAIVCTTQ